MPLRRQKNMLPHIFSTKSVIILAIRAIMYISIQIDNRDQLVTNLKDMGALRNGLHGIALVFALLMPLAHEPDYTSNWNLFFDGVLPALSPLIVIVIGLDIMMSSIWKSDAGSERIQHFNRIIRAHWIFGSILLISWLTVFLPALL